MSIRRVRFPRRLLYGKTGDKHVRRRVRTLQQPIDGKSNPGDSGPTGQNTRPNVVRRSPGPQATYRARPAAPTQKNTPPADAMSQRYVAHNDGAARQRRVRRILLLFLVLFLVGGGAVYAFVLKPTVAIVEKVQQVSTNVFVTPVRVRPAPSGAGPNATPVPVVYPDWNKHEPINILLMGLDY